jgi:hypothetical protein
MQLLIILVPVYQSTSHIPEDKKEEFLDFPFFGQSMGQASPVSLPSYSMGLIS